MRLIAVSNSFIAALGWVLSSTALAGPDMIRLKFSRSLSQPMLEIRYTDRELDQSVLLSRALLFGDKIRMDYGRDDQGYILFDRAANTVWHVSPSDRRLTGYVPGKVRELLPKGWKVSEEAMPSEQGVLTQIRLNDVLCVEFKSLPILQSESALLADFRRALAYRQAKSWQETPETMRMPCSLVLDVAMAGVEYSLGLPSAIRYWDGRTRVYQSHKQLPLRPELFDLPAGYMRSLIKDDDQGNGTRRQPLASQIR